MRIVRAVATRSIMARFCCAAGDFLRRRVKLRGAVFSARWPHVRLRRIGAVRRQALALCGSVTLMSDQQKGRSCIAIDPADVFLDTAGLGFTRSDNTLMHGTVAFLVEILAVCQLDNHAPGTQGRESR